MSCKSDRKTVAAAGTTKVRRWAFRLNRGARAARGKRHNDRLKWMATLPKSAGGFIVAPVGGRQRLRLAMGL